ncbi:glycosyltransferase [Eubacterium limosum]|uniref:glycosyltransferase n=1 Tax=Eubacterium limosum TaxID=1736 RepID=UPI001FA9B170|nr:glycosyltransferase [Eubacterium limosum]
MELHIFIYSDLSVYGGGRETWLDYFLNGLTNNDTFEKITIYSLEPSDYKNSIVPKYEDCKKIDFHYCGRKDNSFFIRLKRYLIITMKDLKIERNDYCLILGTVIEGILGLKIRKKYKNNVKIIPWIRSIVVNEITNRRNSYLSRRIAKLVSVSIEQRLITTADLIICNGMDTYTYYAASYPEYKDKMETIPNAVDIQKFKYTGYNKESKILECCYIGRLEKIKGFNDICEIFTVLENKGYAKKIKCNVWGEGNINNLCFPSNINLYGKAKRNEIPNILSTQDVFLFLSEDSTQGAGGLSHSLLEAMASGKIIIGYDIEALTQVKKIKENGILIKYKKKT